MFALNSVVVILFKTTSCRSPFVEASKMTQGFLPGLTKIPWAVWRQYGEKWSTYNFTGRRWLYLYSLFMVFLTILGYILKVAWLPFSMITAFIFDVSLKLIQDGHPWVRLRLTWPALTSSMCGEISSRICLTFRFLVFANIFTLDVLDSHTRVQGMIDHGSSCNIIVGHLDGFLVGIANARFL